VIGSKAAEAAQITASLTTTQPQAAVGREYIDSTVSPTADFNQLIAITPSVSISGSSNGAGFSETKATIRGFQDGDYNVTYDSIPFADTNNPTHHSTAFFLRPRSRRWWSIAAPATPASSARRPMAATSTCIRAR
jgi:iron complex outermembrane receptor protein